MKSWNGSVNAVVPATARSTCSSPSTSRRTLIPRSARSASSMLAPLPFAGLPLAGLPLAGLPLAGLVRLLVFVRFPIPVGVQGRGNKGIRGAEVADRLERGIDLLRRDAGRRQPVLQLRHGKQHVAQRQSG